MTDASLFRGFDEVLLSENGGAFGFVCIWRRGETGDSARSGVTVGEFLSAPENQSGEWLIDGGWGAPPGAIVVRWCDDHWENGGFGGRLFA